MLESIESATTSIYLEMYIFHDDTDSTHDFVGAFERKARSGVEVVLVLDAVGSIALPRATVERLRTAGVEVRFFRGVFHRMHRKLLIVDGTVAFVGGVNIAEAFREWFDLHVRLEGSIVRSLLASFVKAYRFAGGERRLRVPAVIAKRRRRKVTTWMLEHIPFARRMSLRRYYTRKIDAARVSVDLVTPYFVPDRWLERVIADAVRRNVRVRVLIPYRSNHRFLNVANAHYASRAVANGVEVRLVGGMNHAKAMVIDDYEAMVGSGNLDTLSFERNGELGVFMVERTAVLAIREVLNEWFSKSIPFHTLEHGLSWYGKLLVPFVRVFSGML